MIVHDQIAQTDMVGPRAPNERGESAVTLAIVLLARSYGKVSRFQSVAKKLIGDLAVVS